MNDVLSSPVSTAPLPIAFSVLRVPFFLEPLYDEHAVYVESNRDRLVHKWGGHEGWERQKHRHDLKGRGLAAGIPHFNLDRLAANSMASHRLIQMIGKTYGLHMSESIYDLLNTYYFVEGHSLNDKPRLANVAAQKLSELMPNQAPPTSEELLTFLEGQEGRKEIEHAWYVLQHRLHIHSIPKFIIEGTTVVDGAADASVFVKFFRSIEQRGSIAGTAIFADILGVPPELLQRGSHVRQVME